MSTLYESIKALCDKKGVKPGRMCSEIGISKGLITDLKMGRKKTVQIETAQKIAEYFGVTTDSILKGDALEAEIPEPEDKETAELREIWSSADDEERKVLLEMARLIKQRRQK